MMQLMNTMKDEMYSNFAAIMALLFVLKGSRSKWVEDQPESVVKEKEGVDEADVDRMEVYN